MSDGCESDSSDAEIADFNIKWDDINTATVNVDSKDVGMSGEQVHTKYCDDEAKEAFNLFRVARVYITRISLSITNHRRMRGMGMECRRTLIKLLDTVVKRLSSVLFPTDGRGLYDAYCVQKENEGKIVKRMVNLLRKLRRGSIEKRLV